MTWNALSRPWIPFRRHSGLIEWGAPSLLGDSSGTDPIVAIAVQRPDFDGALMEFFIGLLTIAVGPDTDADWLRRFHEPPSPTELEKLFAALPDAFKLDGDGPRFFQDAGAVDFSDIDVTPIEQLLIDAPGGQTARLNKDLFVKRNRIERLGQPAAAMALLAMQTYAPAGGQGHRTSLRGGGPLTTLVLPSDTTNSGKETSLWHQLWANVLPNDYWEDQPGHEKVQPEDVFPWLARTRTSEGGDGSGTTSHDANPLQMFFGLPRRIRLEFGGPGRCDLTGIEDEQTVVGFRMRNYGVQYVGWRHALSPYYRDAKGQWLPVHGQPGGTAWRDWLGMTMRQADDGAREPARVVTHFLQNRAEQLRQTKVRVYAFGYDMDNMKARGWTESLRPAFAVQGQAHQDELVFTAKRLTEATSIAASALMKAVEGALFERPEDASGDLSQIKGELWNRTEAAFFREMERMATRPPTSTEIDEACGAFVSGLEPIASSIFERWCPMSGRPPYALRQVVSARYNLVLTLRGRSKLGQKLFAAAGLPAVALPPSKGRKKARQEPES